MSAQAESSSGAKNSSDVDEETYLVHLKELEESRKAIFSKIENLYNEILYSDVKDKQHFRKLLAKDKKKWNKYEESNKKSSLNVEGSRLPDYLRHKKSSNHSLFSANDAPNQHICESHSSRCHDCIQHQTVPHNSEYHGVLWNCSNQCNMECVYCILNYMAEKTDSVPDSVGSKEVKSHTHHSRKNTDSKLSTSKSSCKKHNDSAKSSASNVKYQLEVNGESLHSTYNLHECTVDSAVASTSDDNIEDFDIDDTGIEKANESSVQENVCHSPSSAESVADEGAVSECSCATCGSIKKLNSTERHESIQETDGSDKCDSIHETKSSDKRASVQDTDGSEKHDSVEVTGETDNDVTNNKDNSVPTPEVLEENNKDSVVDTPILDKNIGSKDATMDVPHARTKTKFKREQLKMLSITIPEPFNLQLCNREKRWRKCTEDIMHSIEKERALRRNQRIHANPIPGHTFLPLYQKMVEENSERQKIRKLKVAEKHRSLSRPFSFATEKRHLATRRCLSASNIYDEKAVDSSENQFKAKPVPTKIIGPETQLKINLEEDLRKMRIQLRANEMLKNSALPFTPKKRKFKHCCSLHCTDDYGNVKNKEDADMDAKKVPDKKTVFQPFSLKTSNLPVRKRCHIQKEEKTEITKPVILPYKSFSAPTSPIRMNVAAQLRANLVQQKLLEEKKNNLKFALQDKENKLKKQDIYKEFLWKINDKCSYSQETIKARLKSLRQSAAEREREYQRELEEIKERVRKRPLLIERQSIEAAKKFVDRKYRDKLHEVGLDVEYVLKQSNKFSPNDRSVGEYEHSYSSRSASEYHSESRSKTEMDDGSTDDDGNEEGEDLERSRSAPSEEYLSDAG